MVFYQVAGVDASGNDIVLGHSADPWEATVTIVSSTDPSATLSEATAYFGTNAANAFVLFESMCL